jgi:hypothetical protein
MATIKQRYAPDIKHYKYLIHPLKQNGKITEGFLYSEEERNVHAFYFHKAIDYACNWKTPVYASASGYAVAGYHRFTLLNKDKTPRLYKSKPLSLGLGYFVQIYHPYKICKVKGGRITQYGHLSKFADGIYAKTHRALKINYKKEIIRKNNERRKYKKSKEEIQKSIKEIRKLIWKYPWIKRLYGFSFSDDINKKESYLYTPKQLKELHEKGDRYVKWVKQGDLIGYTGTSALIHGRLKYLENRRRPNMRKFKTWDETHLHFEEASRDWKTGKKILPRDPYGIYLSKEHYQNFRFDTLFVDFEKKFSL